MVKILLLDPDQDPDLDLVPELEPVLELVLELREMVGMMGMPASSGPVLQPAPRLQPKLLPSSPAKAGDPVFQRH